MTDCLESLLSSMSSKFNADLDVATAATATAGDGGGGGVGGGGGGGSSSSSNAAALLNLAEDKTLKWRNLANNQFACKDKERKLKKLIVKTDVTGEEKDCKKITIAAVAATDAVDANADDGAVEQNIKELLAEEEEEEALEEQEENKTTTTTKAETKDISVDIAAATSSKETPEVRTTTALTTTTTTTTSTNNDQGQQVENDDDRGDATTTTTTKAKATTTTAAAAAKKSNDSLSAAALLSLQTKTTPATVQQSNDDLLIVVKLEEENHLSHNNPLVANNEAAETATEAKNTKTTTITSVATVAAVADDVFAVDLNNETRSTSVSPLRRLRRMRRPSEAAADVESGKTNSNNSNSAATVTNNACAVEAAKEIVNANEADKPQILPPKRGRGRARKIPITNQDAVEQNSGAVEMAAENVSRTAATTPTTEKKVGRKRKQPEDESEQASPSCNVKSEETPVAATATDTLLDISGDNKRMRRSVRLGNRMDGFKILEGPALDEIKIEAAGGTSSSANIVALDPLSLTDAISQNDLRMLHTPPILMLDEKTPPKKRGRKAKIQQPPEKQQLSVAIGGGSVCESNDQTTSSAAAGQYKRNSASADLVIPKRSQRRIKPTTKILENDELRYEFETKNIERITAQSWEASGAGSVAGVDVSHCETTPTHQVVLATATTPSNEKCSNFGGSKQKSERSEASGDSHHQHHHPTTGGTSAATAASVKKKLFSKSRRDIEASGAAVEAQKARRRHCPDVTQFLNDIKAAKLNLNKSPEERKLSKKQLRKLTKQKERHLEKLGLRRRNPSGAAEAASSDAADSSSGDSDEFVPTTRVRVGKPSVTLRLRTTAKEIVAAVPPAPAPAPAKLTRKLPQRQKLTPPPVQTVQEKEDNAFVVTPAITIATTTATSSTSTSHSNPPAAALSPSLLEIAPSQLSALNAALIVPAASSAVPRQRQFICLCRKPSQYYTRNTPETSFCCAIDNIEEQKVGCCNQLDGEVLNLLRPSQRVGYMVLCEDHKKRLRAHNCCPGCGMFCTQGQFVLCKQQHFFHPECAQKFILNSPYDPLQPLTNYASPTLVLKCPHCGNDTTERTSTVTMKCQSLPVFLPSQKTKINPAKMSIAPLQGEMPVVASSSNNAAVVAAANTTTTSSSAAGANVDANATANAGSAISFEQIIPESVMNVVGRSHVAAGERAEFSTRDLYYAVKNDDLERVAEILASDYDVTTRMREHFNGTCLHLVADFGTLQMAYLLLRRCFSKEFINCIDQEQRTAVICAVLNNKCDILNLLIQHCADLAVKGPEGKTCLHFAARLGNLEAVTMIVKYHTSTQGAGDHIKFVNSQDEGGWTAMLWAAELGHTEIVIRLIQHYASTNICDNENNSALHWATLHNNSLETITILLQAHSNPNIQNSDGDTPLHIACRHSMLRVCIALIANGSELLIKNNDNEIPYDCIPDHESECARTVLFNMQMRSFRPLAMKPRIVSHDISMGREYRPIQAERYYRSAADVPGAEPPNEADQIMLPDFRYIVESIILQNSIQIDTRVSQMRICSCTARRDACCTTDACQCTGATGQLWYTQEGRLRSDFNYDDPVVIFECNDVCGCSRILCKNRVVQKGIRTAMEVFECQDPAKGWGVRTLVNIAQGSFIAQYTGEILTDFEADRRTDDSYFFDLGHNQCIDANFYGNVSRFFNHSCEPNIVPVRVFFEHQDYRFPKISFFANQDIAVGTELCFDYGDKFWSVKNRLFSCKCLTYSCRYAAINKSDVDNQGQKNSSDVDNTEKLSPPPSKKVAPSNSNSFDTASSSSNLTNGV